jgi:hypothetical protein
MDTIGECIASIRPVLIAGKTHVEGHGPVLGVWTVHAGAWGATVIRFVVYA